MKLEKTHFPPLASDDVPAGAIASAVPGVAVVPADAAVAGIPAVPGFPAVPADAAEIAFAPPTRAVLPKRRHTAILGSREPLVREYWSDVWLRFDHCGPALRSRKRDWMLTHWDADAESMEF